MRTIPLHETHDERLDRKYPHGPLVFASTLRPSVTDVLALRTALDRFNARHIDVIVNARVRQIRAMPRIQLSS